MTVDRESLDDFQFYLKKQYWYVSFLTEIEDKGVMNSICNEIENVLMDELKRFTEDDLQFIQNPEEKDLARKTGKNIEIKCNQIIIDDYCIEKYTKLGFFAFEVNYYKSNSKQIRYIRPNILQTIAYKANLILTQNFTKQFEFDKESPILVFTISTDYNKLNSSIKWSNETIDKYKVELGKWIGLYSGQWDDYDDRLYRRRIENQLSNRKSELHFITRNSGFIYMDEINFDQHFDKYILKKVLIPTIELRTVLFSIVKMEKLLNSYLENLYNKQYQRKNISEIENEIEILDQLKINIDTNISKYYILLSYNLRQHYSSVIGLLIDLYKIKENSNRVNQKFSEISNRLVTLHNQIAQKNARKQESALTMLNLIIGLSVILDILAIIVLKNVVLLIINLIFLGVIGVYLLYYIGRVLYYRIQNRRKK